MQDKQLFMTSFAELEETTMASQETVAFNPGDAASIAGMLLTTECAIVDIPEPEPPMPAGGPGGGMGMM